MSRFFSEPISTIRYAADDITKAIGGIANEGIVWLFNQFSDWLFGWIVDALSKFANLMFRVVHASNASFWTTPVIELILNFSGVINMVVLIVTLIFVGMDIAEQSGAVNWAIIFKNLMKGFLFVFFNRFLGLFCYTVVQEMVLNMKIAIVPPDNSVMPDFIVRQNSGFAIVVVYVAIIAATIAFFIMSLMRNGTLFVHILSSSFYIPDVVRGDTSRLGEWIRQAVAISGTWFIQYLLFYIGLNYVAESRPESFITVGTCWVTMFFVPKILERFGYSSGARSVLSSAGHVMSSGLRVASGFI